MNPASLSRQLFQRALPGKCHLLYDTCRLLIFVGAAGAGLAAEPAAGADACCKEEPAAKKPACCTAMAAAPAEASAKEDSGVGGASLDDARGRFTRDSLYQLDATFTADSGRPFALGDLRGRPVVLTMFFATCGYACPLLVTDMQALREKLPAAIRDRAHFVLVSFDVVRDTPAALAAYRAQRSLDRQWTLLHGGNDAVRELAALLGVKYKQEADGAFSHSNLFTILNADGEIIHQRTGLQGGLDEAATALAAAAQ